MHPWSSTSPRKHGESGASPAGERGHGEPGAPPTEMAADCGVDRLRLNIRSLRLALQWPHKIRQAA